MSKTIDNEKQFNDVIKNNDAVFVLFYASWCPFSKEFMPIFEKYAREKKSNFVFIKVNDNDELCEKYSIEVFPTVYYFKQGNVSKMLHGIAGEGLTDRNLDTLIKECSR